MALITWLLADGSRIEAEVNNGENLMVAATFEGVPGIDGDCGGCLSCATCHVVISEDWAQRVGMPGREEDTMLGCTAAPRQPHSRLSCQVLASDLLDGLVVQVPRA